MKGSPVLIEIMRQHRNSRNSRLSREECDILHDHGMHGRVIHCYGATVAPADDPRPLK